MIDAPPTALEKFTTLFRLLSVAVAGRGMWGNLPSALMLFINLRIHRINWRVRTVIEQLRAGTYAPRRTTPGRRNPAPRRARQPGLVPLKFGWLDPLLPEIAPFRGQLNQLLQDPEVVALIAAAPAALGRPLRSLCWMLKFKPPAILAPPRRVPLALDKPALAAPQPAPATAPPPPQSPARATSNRQPRRAPARASPKLRA